MPTASTVTVSTKYQIVIPEEIRTRFKIKPGQKFEVIEWNGGIRLVPVRPIQEFRGFLKGMVNDFEREPDREL